MNKDKIFTSARKIFKSGEELKQEEVLDIEQQDIAQEIEQLRAEIKAFYLEHPDKDPSMPDKIYVKDMNELEEKITEHIPKKVVEDEIIIKNIIEQEGSGGSGPLDFSRMKEYDLPDEYRSQVFSPNIADDVTKDERDTVVDYIDRKSDTDTVKELFGEELSKDMQSIDGEETAEIEDAELNEVQVDLSLLKESLDSDLLQQLQEQRKENEQEAELKNRIFTHQGFAKEDNYIITEEAGTKNSHQEEKLQEQGNDDTKNMSDLLSKLLSEGKLEADLYNEENQEGSTDEYIPGLNVENVEETNIEGDNIDIANSGDEESLTSRNEEETRENHDSNLSDLLSDLLSSNPNNVDKEQMADEDPDTEDYHNRVFISSVKAAKQLPGLEEQSIEDNQKEDKKDEYKPGEKVIFQEYGEDDEEAIEINLNNLIKEDSDIKVDNPGMVENQQDHTPIDNNNRLEDNLKSHSVPDNESLKSLLNSENLEENDLDLRKEIDDTSIERQDQESNINNLKQQINTDEDRVSALEELEDELKEDFDYDDKTILESEQEEIVEQDKVKILQDKKSAEQDNIENILNSLLDDSDSNIEKDSVKDENDILAQVMESTDNTGFVKDQTAAIPIENKGILLNETPIEKQDNIENILDSLLQVTGSDSIGIQEKGSLANESVKQSERRGETIFSDSQKIIQKKKADPINSVLPEEKKKVEKITRRENTKKSTENKKIATELLKTDHSIHAVKVLAEEKRQSLFARLLQKLKDMFRKKPKMEIISQEAAIDESNVYKSQEKETFINGLITGSVSGDNVTLNPLAVVKKDVIAQGKVLCLSGAAIMGKVNCESIIVEGTVFGEIEARGKVIIKNDALVLGNIYSSDVRITQGAMVQGDIFFKNPERKGK
ncbi:polymer-forming cytoskeletal protein [uncultured Robinsoniella sp.]|uniref:bactofilin family protein n=1 Tax=uncultured Robinsoniella sp. TaxID=904190 RepID=UPI00374EF69B